MTTPPKSILANEFKPRFDTSTTAGKIAVMQEAVRVGYVYMKDGLDEWIYRDNPAFDDKLKFYNFPAEPKRTLVPWTKDTVPREAWFRRVEVTTQRQESPLGGIGKDTVLLGENVFTYQELHSNFEHSLDGGKTWLPCGTWKEEEV